MSFRPKSYEQILADMIAHVQANTVLSDFTVGSVVRTILETAALEDDEQYFQMVQLLDAFSIINATGEDLDGRVADYNIFRRNATFAVGTVVFANNNLISDQIAMDDLVGSTSLQLFTTAAFPISYPYSVRVAEGTSRVQDLTVINNNTSTGILTLSTPTIDDVLVGDRTSYIDTSASPTNINIGTNVQVPPNVGNPARIFSTEETASILPGNYYSNEVFVRAKTAGVSGNVAPGKISQFLGTKPFTGALVTNLRATGGGLDKEKDKELRTRALSQVQSLSRGTPLALKTAAVGVVDETSGKSVVSSNIIEDFVSNEVNIYIDDGTGLTPTIQTLAQDSLAVTATAGASSVVLTDASNFPSSGYVLIELDGSANAPELLKYTGIENTALLLATPSTVTHTLGSIVNYVEPVTLAAEAGERRFNLPYYPIVRFSDKVFVDQGAGWVLLNSATDYVLNRGTGEFQIVDTAGVLIGSRIVCNFDYYTNLIAKVQKVLEGDPDDFINYPGVKAAGIFLNVEPPILRRITVRAEISADRGYKESDLYPAVIENIETYIRNLGIGEDVIVSELVYAAQRVVGLRDVQISIPTTNIVILENELPVPFNSSGETLVQVV